MPTLWFQPEKFRKDFLPQTKAGQGGGACRHPYRQALWALKAGANKRYEPNEHFCSRLRWLVLSGQVARLKK